MFKKLKFDHLAREVKNELVIKLTKFSVLDHQSYPYPLLHFQNVYLCDKCLRLNHSFEGWWLKLVPLFLSIEPVSHIKTASNLLQSNKRNRSLKPNDCRKVQLGTREAEPVTFCHLVTLVNILIMCVVSSFWLSFCCPKEINMLRQRSDNLDKVNRGRWHVSEHYQIL